jgi:hypothetical protein
MIKRLTAGWLMALALLVGAASNAAPLTFATSLSGPAEDPPNNSPGIGSAVVIFDADADTMRVIAEFSGLVALTTAAHIHCCTADPFAATAGVATMVPSFFGFPLGVTSGSMDETFDLGDPASWNPAFVTASGGTVEQAEQRLLSGLLSGRAYFNVHSETFRGGEIRGFLVPEPSSLALFAACLLALAAVRRRAR